MPTTTVKTIGSGGDYSTLQAWEDAAPTNLVSADQIWEGQMLAGTNFTSSSTLLTISGSTTDSTRFKRLRCASGASFRDNASVQTNALRWNSSNGASIECTGGYGVAISVQEAYTQLVGLQIKATYVAVDVSALTYLDYCIIEGQGLHDQALVGVGAAVRARNCAFIKTGTGNGMLRSAYAVEAYNCTFVAVSGVTGTYAIVQGYANATIKNCAVFNCDPTYLYSGGTATVTTSYTDAAGPPSGWTAAVASTAIESITAGSPDLRLKSGSALIDAGTTDSTNAATDIAGTSRPSGSAYDVGAWEYVSAGGGGGGGGSSSDADSQTATRGLGRGLARGLARLIGDVIRGPGGLPLSA